MGWAFTQPILFTFGSELFLGNLANKVTDQAGELHREDVLGGRLAAMLLRVSKYCRVMVC